MISEMPKKALTNYILLGLLGGALISLSAQEASKPAPSPKTPSLVVSAPVPLPPGEISEYWRTSNEVSQAQINLERTPQAGTLKDRIADRQVVIEKLARLCPPNTTLASAEEKNPLGLKAGTPFCQTPAPAPVGSGLPGAPDIKDVVPTTKR